MSKREINDPVEKIIADALDLSGTRYVHGSEGGTFNLDFYIPRFDLYIECKRFHTPRTCEQMSRVLNIIVVQGIEAAHVMARMLRGLA